MKQKDIDKMVKRHGHWVHQDCRGYANMRAVQTDKDFTGIKMASAFLPASDFSSSCLAKADLENVTLSKATLKHTDFFEAKMSYAMLNAADMELTRFDCADLMYANMYGTKGICTKFNKANLTSANFSRSHFCNAEFVEANLHGANFDEAEMHGAKFCDADLTGADFRGANLYCADFRGAKLEGARFDRSNLTFAKFSDNEKYRKGVILDKPINGYKKTDEGVILVAQIPAGAVVFCVNGNKCRTNRAKVISTGGHHILHSSYDTDFTYKEGQQIVIENFSLDCTLECAPGFHFFRTRKEAEAYST